MLRALEHNVRRLRRRVEASIAGIPQPAAARALSWIRANHLPGGGIRVESGHRYAYPEVTGYLVPTLLVAIRGREFKLSNSSSTRSAHARS